jgi:hypothetical protein
MLLFCGGFLRRNPAAASQRRLMGFSRGLWTSITLKTHFYGLSANYLSGYTVQEYLEKTNMMQA